MNCLKVKRILPRAVIYIRVKIGELNESSMYGLMYRKGNGAARERRFFID